MVERILYALFFTVVLIIVPLFGVGILRLEKIFLFFLPYFSMAIFIFGVIYRISNWALSPQPFRIPLVAGQQKSLGWVKPSFVESPYNLGGVFLRMALEILLFRSLLRNEKVNTHPHKWLLFTSKKELWFFAILFHYSLLLIVIKHLRLFFEPIPSFVNFFYRLDTLFEIFLPTVSISEILVIIALSFLLLRRILIGQVRYVSYVSDYFPLFLIFSVVISGILVRYFFRVDIMEVKRFTLGLFLFRPYVPQSFGLAFYLHFFLVCFLFAYFPLSKLIHAGGIFLSPTRNLENTSRQKRHINPWDYPVKVRTYEDWENEFREMMKEAKIPLERENS